MYKNVLTLPRNLQKICTKFAPNSPVFSGKMAKINRNKCHFGCSFE